MAATIPTTPLPFTNPILNLPPPLSPSLLSFPSPRHLTRLLRLSIRNHGLNHGRSIHAVITKSQPYDDSTRLLNLVISMYLSLGRLSDARTVFDEMTAPDVASFASLISAYAKTDQETECCRLFDRMRWLGIDPNEFGFVALLTNCIRQSNLRLGSQVHAFAVKTWHCSSVYVANAVIGMYVSCGCFDDAVEVFGEMRERDVSSWNAVISAMVKDCRYREAFGLFREMKREGKLGDRFSISALLTAASEGFFVEEGETVHAHALKLGLDLDLSVGNALVRFYTEFGGVEDVVGVFERMPVKDVISWTGMLNGFMEFGFVESGVKIFSQMPERNAVSYNALLAGFCKNGDGLRGLQLFQQMLNDGVQVSVHTLTSVANASAMVGDRKTSGQVHGFVIKMGFGSNAWIEAALLDMCAKCDRMEDAEEIYDRKIQRGGFPITWNSLISARARSGQPEEALSLFRSGLKRDDLLEVIDEVTLATVLGVCGTLGFAEMGEQIHGFAHKSELIADIGVGNAMVSMYSKCGILDDAVAFFNQMPRYNLVSWNALITSYLLHRKGDDCLKVWSEMERLGLRPDHITFLMIISACKFTGSDSVGTCREMFLSMAGSYGMKPASEHYAALVDVLACWGRFDPHSRGPTLRSKCALVKSRSVGEIQGSMAPKPITSPVPDAWYPTLAVLMLSVGLVVTASFFIYEATSSRRNRSLSKEIATGAVASVFLGFGSLFLLLSTGVYV